MRNRTYNADKIHSEDWVNNHHRENLQAAPTHPMFLHLTVREMVFHNTIHQSSKCHFTGFPFLGVEARDKVCSKHLQNKTTSLLLNKISTISKYFIHKMPKPKCPNLKLLCEQVPIHKRLELLFKAQTENIYLATVTKQQV